MPIELLVEFNQEQKIYQFTVFNSTVALLTDQWRQPERKSRQYLCQMDLHFVCQRIDPLSMLAILLNILACMNADIRKLRPRRAKSRHRWAIMRTVCRHIACFSILARSTADGTLFAAIEWGATTVA
jgi:hypothetical protein